MSQDRPAKPTWLYEYIEGLLKIGKQAHSVEFQMLMKNPVFGGEAKIREMARSILARLKEEDKHR